MFAIEDFLRVSNQMRDYYAKKIKDSFQEFNFSPNEISILIVLKNNSTITTSTELKGKRQVICWIENHFKKIDNYIEH